MVVPSQAQDRLTEAFVLDRCRNFVDFGLWPVSSELNPAAWLTNFTLDEKPYALHLLNSFLFMSTEMTAQIFFAGFQNISSYHHQGRTFIQARNSWRHFCNTVCVTYVTGEQPNPTDSGYHFARLARQRLAIEQDQILTPEEAIARIAGGATFPLVIVDDFAGSGQQFIKSWKRRYSQLSTSKNSFALATKGRSSPIYFCPAVCTTRAVTAIGEECKGVVVSSGNVLPPENSALHEESNVWPDHLRRQGSDFLQKASERAGIPDNGGGEFDWRGYHKLGLCIAFEHSTPDATLTLFSWEQNGWRPLIRRR